LRGLITNRNERTKFCADRPGFWLIERVLGARSFDFLCYHKDSLNAWGNKITMGDGQVICRPESHQFLFLLGYLQAILDTASLLAEKQNFPALSLALDLIFQLIPDEIVNLDTIDYDRFFTGPFSSDLILIIKESLEVWKEVQEIRTSQKEQIDFSAIRRKLNTILQLITQLKLQTGMTSADLKSS